MRRNKLLLLSLMALLLACGCENTNISSNNENPSSTPEAVSTPEVSTTDSSTDEDSSSEIIAGPTELYVSPDAKSFDAKGTIDDPMLIQYAIRRSRPGSTIYLLDGIYEWGDTIMMDRTTEDYLATKPEEGKILRPLNKGKVTIDFSMMAWASSNRGIQVNTNYWTIRDLEVRNAGDNGIYIGGSYNTVENCVTHDCGDTGIQLGRANSTLDTIDEWPSYNLIKNCTSFDNHDPLGEDSDGFACKLTTGVGNVFDGCIAYNNVDDGWDLYTKGDSGEIGPVTLINCIAFNNLASGFTDNSNPGPLYLENCTSYNNGLRDSDANNIDMCRDENTSVNYIKNTLSYCDQNIKFTDGFINKRIGLM